jgi:hypothetical protein
MKTKIISIVGLFVLLALGTVLLLATETKAAETVSFEQAAQGYVVPMIGSCNFFCPKCVPLNGGACTAAKVCC